MRECEGEREAEWGGFWGVDCWGFGFIVFVYLFIIKIIIILILFMQTQGNTEYGITNNIEYRIYRIICTIE